MLAQADSNLEFGNIPACLANLHLAIDCPVTFLIYLTQGGLAPFDYTLPKQVCWLMGHEHQETGKLDL